MSKQHLNVAGLAGILLLSPLAGRAYESTKKPRIMRVGAVAYAPGAVTVFEGMRRYFARHNFPMDYVLYSNYDALVEALHDGQVDIAWNTPLAHARYHLLAGNQSQTLAMRDVDCGFRCKLIVRKESGIVAPGDLKGKTLVLGSWDAARGHGPPGVLPQAGGRRVWPGQDAESR
jgi:ABC-type phosphate/phosphonate transport system substrate-binding protein